MNVPVNDSASFTPRARRDNVQVQVIGNEVLVFDLQRDEAHVLNRPAAFVWQNADGTRTIGEIAQAMTVEFGLPADVATVRYALEQLDRKQLLEASARLLFATPPMSRRQFLKRAAAGAALLAVVTSIVAPTPAHAQSGCVGEGGACTDTSQCCTGGVIPMNCCFTPGGQVCLVGACPV
jgi:hypothetical protein